MNNIKEYLSDRLKNKDLYIDDETICVESTNDMFVVTNGAYKAYVKVNNYINKDNIPTPRWFTCKNPYIVYNINKYFELFKDDNFVCLSKREDIVNRDSIIYVKCNRCGEIIETSLRKITRFDMNHRGITCPNCDGRNESLHALVLKQLFMHYYPDTELEERSCINPNTGCVMATDIVNHRMKIAIEVQGQWHRYDKQKERDEIKKKFWIDKGYDFYDYSIDNVSALDYIRYFFPDITEIPDWVNLEYSNKLNYIQIQKMLDSGKKVNVIADELCVNVHRIYDALHCGNLHYPDTYIKSTRRPIVQISMKKEYIGEFGSYTDAALANNIDKSGILTCVHTGSYYSNGYYWVPKDLYDTGNYNIPPNRLDKFYNKVNKIDNTGNIVASFDNLLDAAKDIDSIAYKIYEVATGVRKSVKGFRYEFA